MRESLKSSVSQKTCLGEEELFEARSYPLANDEKAIIRSLSAAILGENFSFAKQLVALGKNLNATTRDVEAV